jgi:transcriptional regulator with XRE-family HTH domain
MNAYPFESGTTGFHSPFARTAVVMLGSMGMLSNATSATLPDASRFVPYVEATTIPDFASKTDSEKAISLKDCVLDLKRLSGLTWEELGKIFGVSRRSVHNWALGERLTEENAAKVRLALANVRKLFDSSPAKTAGILRGMRGETPLFEALLSAKLTDGSSAETSLPTYPKFDTDASRLMANWNPTSLNQILETESVVDETPLRNMKSLAVRVPKLPKRPSAG